MERLSMILWITLSFVFVSCGGISTKPKERCGIQFSQNNCRCTMYDIRIPGPVGEGYDRPLEYCDGVLGFKVEDWLEYITPKIKDAWRWCYDHKSCRRPMKMKHPPMEKDIEVERLIQIKNQEYLFISK